jgi:TIR domain
LPSLSPRGIFLSYRRQETAPHARMLKEKFSGRFPDTQVFMDLDSIEAGRDFAEVIAQAVRSCAVLVALIGPQWATITDEQGHRRLDAPHDYVRFEVRTALERDVRVIPVLVDGARPLRQEQLPKRLRKLARLNAHTLSLDHYEYDATRLLDLIQRVLAEAPAARVIASSRWDQLQPLSALATAFPAKPARNNRDRAARLFADAERIARSVTSGMKGSVAEHIAREQVLQGVAEALAASDPDRAERIARSMTLDTKKASALSGVAKALAASDPGRAARLITEAERVIPTISVDDAFGDFSRERLVSDVAQALAAIDPDRAERLARSITKAWYKDPALGDVAQALAVTDPDRAERLARSITTDYLQAPVLSGIARALTATNPGRAARFLTEAERIARSLTDEGASASAWSSIAQALAATDPGRAARLFTEAERIAQSITSESGKASALRDVAMALAATDPDRAERIAQSITDQGNKALALSGVAKALAATSP